MGNSEAKNCDCIPAADWVGSSKTKLNLPPTVFLADINLNPLMQRKAAKAKSAVSNVFTILLLDVRH